MKAPFWCPKSSATAVSPVRFAVLTTTNGPVWPPSGIMERAAPQAPCRFQSRRAKEPACSVCSPDDGATHVFNSIARAEEPEGGRAADRELDRVEAEDESAGDGDDDAAPKVGGGEPPWLIEGSAVNFDLAAGCAAPKL